MFNYLRKKVASKWTQDSKEKDQREEKRAAVNKSAGAKAAQNYGEQVATCAKNKTKSLEDHGRSISRSAETNAITRGPNESNAKYFAPINSDTCRAHVTGDDAVADTCETVVDARNGCQLSDRLTKADHSSRRSKEVVNLLLPEESLAYKKEESYFSKGLLNIMGGRKKRNKCKKSKDRRSWSFSGSKSEGEGADLQRSASACGPPRAAGTPAKTVGRTEARGIPASQSGPIIAKCDTLHGDESPADDQSALGHRSDKRDAVTDTQIEANICVQSDCINQSANESATHSGNRLCLLESPCGDAMGAAESSTGGKTSSHTSENTPVPFDASREPINLPGTALKVAVQEETAVDCVALEKHAAGRSTPSEYETPAETNETEAMPESIEEEDKRLKNILKVNVLEEGRVVCKKHVTFHSVINFDDGDNVEDEVLDEESVVEESYASLDDLSDGEEFDMDKADNQEVLEPDSTEDSEQSASDSANKKSENSGDNEHFGVVKNTHDEDHAEFIDAEETEIENNENLGCESFETAESVDEISSEEMESISQEVVPVEDACSTIIEVKEIEEDESEEEYEETESESCETENSSSADGDTGVGESIFDSEQVIEEVKRQEIVVEKEEEDDSAYSELLRVVEKQLMRGLAGQEGKLADLQERAAALHRVQSEVCSARKEAELIRQKLRHVEGDLSATRSRNCHLLEELEAKADEIRTTERRSDELAGEVVRLQQRLDQLIPEAQNLKELNESLKKERDHEKKINDESAARQQLELVGREKAWKLEFERLRSQGAEQEEMMLADCEWKLRDVQKAAAERCRRAEGRLQELQTQADQRCAAADRQVQELRTEMATLRATSLEQQRTLRQQATQSGILEAAKDTLEQEAKRLRTLLVMEKDAMQTVKQQHAKELDEKEQRLVVRLADEARRAEQQGRQQRKQEECIQHEKLLHDTYKKLEELKELMAKKEAQFIDKLYKAEGRADWQIMEIRRTLDKAELKHAEALEKLEEQYTEDTERLTNDSERRIKELESALSAQACSARATLELVRGQLQAEHADMLQKMKEQHRKDMEKQWELFESDKEQCLERMKAECLMEGEEDREKRDKDLLRSIDDLKHELATREGDVGSLRHAARKEHDARLSAERRLSEAQSALAARETAVRAEAARQAEAEKREARDTIDHLTKKCACLTNLFEDMRSRWQQAPGEAAQLRRALQDEKARAQALRRQLDALSRVHKGPRP